MPRTRQTHHWLPVILLFLLFNAYTSPCHADLGLGSDDFDSQSVTGSKVDGRQVHVLESCTTGQCGGTEEPSDNDHDEPGGDNGDPGQNSPQCQKNEGNGTAEGDFCSLCSAESTTAASKDSTTESTNSDHTVAVNSFVNVYTRQYQDDLVDMEVKVAGGYARVLRLYAEGAWQFEHEFNRIRPTNKVNTLKKADLIYTKGNDGLYHYKTFTLKQLENGYRWQSKKGNYVRYDRQGRMVETGNRIGVLTRYVYEGDQLSSINDRTNTPVFHFTYNNAGKITKSMDNHGRSVTYTWDNNLLSRVTDVLGHGTRYQYSDENRLTIKADEVGRKFFITYYPSGGVKSVLSREGGGKYFAYESNYAKITTAMGHKTEYWFYPDGETERVAINGHTIRRDKFTEHGRVTIDEIGNLITKTYDKNNNLLKKEFGDGRKKGDRFIFL